MHFPVLTTLWLTQMIFVRYQMLKHLPVEVLNTLLSILNDIWLTVNMTLQWNNNFIEVTLKTH